jgi:hypothetical protein
MKKVLIIILILFVLVGAAGNVYQYMYYGSTLDDTMQQHEQQIVRLQTIVDEIGPMVSVLAMSMHAIAGTEVSSNHVMYVDIPLAAVTEHFIYDVSQLEGQLYKINVRPGQLLTTDMLMAVAISDSMRPVDVPFSFTTIGLMPGDYVDIVLLLPFGQEYVVLSHQRVADIFEANLVRLLMTGDDRMILRGAQLDWYRYRELGAELYAIKYLEPGLQTPAREFYVPPASIIDMINVDINLQDQYNVTLMYAQRLVLDAMLLMVCEDEAGLITGGRAEFRGSVNSINQEIIQALVELAQMEEFYAQLH